jgi:YesN/AraC family two-component response regulator
MPFERRSHHPVILCVDDEREILYSLQRCLSAEPYEVVTAQGADEALGWLEELPIDLVITDQRMPGTPGTELLREVRKRSPKTAGAILTAYPTLSLVKEGLEAGAEAFLNKPWSDDSLKEMIRSILGNSPR